MKKRSIKTKFAALNIISVSVVITIFLIIIFYQKGQANKNIEIELNKLIDNNMGIMAQDVYKQIEALNGLLQSEVDNGLKVAKKLMNNRGAVFTSPGQSVQWEAVNQFTQEKKNITLPRLMIGNEWIGQNTSIDTPSPVVDETLNLVGGTTTIFQKMNDQGDMLRVCTNVQTKDGKRAIGTYIPAVNPDGQPNPVIKAVLAGQIFKGKAFVVNAMYLTAYEPIYNAQKDVIGMLYFGIRQEKSEALRKGILNTVVGSTGYIFVLNAQGDTKGHYVISKNGERDGENIYNAKDDNGKLFIQKIIKKALELSPGDYGIERYPWKNKDEDSPRWKRVAFTYFEPWDWLIGASTYEEDFQHIKNGANNALFSIVFWTICTACFAMIVILSLSFYLTGRIAEPLNQVVGLLKNIAEGEGDLTRRLSIHTNDEVHELGHWFNLFVEKLTEIIHSIKGASSRIHSAMEEIASESHDLAERTNEQAASITETSTTLEEFTSSVRVNSENSTETEKMLVNLDNELKSKGELVGNVTQTMKDIFESSKQIDNIIAVINDISFQTNLLALNAAVEAARAGEAGRGFAVVAAEVRNLAQKTAESSKTIQGIVSGNVSATQKGMTLVKQTSEFFLGISKIMDEMVERVGNINNSTKEQKTGIEQINVAIIHLDQVSNQNAALVDALSRSTKDMRSSTAELEGLVEKFTIH